MDRESLIQGLQNAFDGDEKYNSKSEENLDVEYKADTNSLLVNKAVEAQILEKQDAEVVVMTEEELFERLRNERRNG